MKKTLMFSIILVLCIPAAAFSQQGVPFEKLQAEIQTLQNQVQALQAQDVKLQNQINNIQLIQGPPGPAGPQGPAGPPGPAGTFDTTKYYFKDCFNVGECFCNSAGDAIINGGALCLPGQYITYSFAIGIKLDDTPWNYGWKAACSNPSESSNSEPEHIVIVCLTP